MGDAGVAGKPMAVINDLKNKKRKINPGKNRSSVSRWARSARFDQADWC